MSSWVFSQRLYYHRWIPANCNDLIKCTLMPSCKEKRRNCTLNFIFLLSQVEWDIVINIFLWHLFSLRVSLRHFLRHLSASRSCSCYCPLFLSVKPHHCTSFKDRYFLLSSLPPACLPFCLIISTGLEVPGGQDLCFITFYLIDLIQCVAHKKILAVLCPWKTQRRYTEMC